MQEELTQLWKVERPIITQTVHEAAKNGDRSENGDYIYGKKRLREIDSRVRFLTKRLDELTIVEQIPSQQDKVFFGALVTIEDEDGTENTYQIVGPDEFNITLGLLSMDAPLAKLLLGKSLDDEVFLETAEGRKEFVITDIRYEPYSQE